MKNKFSTSIYTIVTGIALFSACDKKNDPVTPTTQGKYVVLTADPLSNTSSGYISTYDDIPSGSISNIKTNSLQSLGVTGFRPFGKWIFRGHNTANEVGIQKNSISSDGTLKDEGFIKVGSATSYGTNYLIVNETTGYYYDDALGNLKIQKFNPSSLARTGEIDLSTILSKSGEEFISVGQHVLAAKEGKLYADVHYGSAALKGFLDAKYDTAYLAIIDIATSAYEKTIKIGGVKGIGYLTENTMWDLSDDGSLYFCSLAGVQGGNSKVVRIKQGQTSFDASWALKMDDFKQGSAFTNAVVKNGKFYTQISTEAIASNYSNLYGDIWEVYSIDINTKVATKITGLPVTRFSGNTNGIEEIDGKLYFRIINTAQSINGYYVLNSDGVSASPVFNITAGGNVSGFAKLQ